MAESDELLTTAQVAGITGLSIATINRQATDGKLPYALKLPGLRGAYLFRREDIRQQRLAEVDALTSKLRQLKKAIA